MTLARVYILEHFRDSMKCAFHKGHLTGVPCRNFQTQVRLTIWNSDLAATQVFRDLSEVFSWSHTVSPVPLSIFVGRRVLTKESKNGCRHAEKRRHGRQARKGT